MSSSGPQKIQTPKAPGAIGPYSQAIATGDLLFCSGQIPLDPVSMTMVEGDIAAQTRRVLENLRGVLEAGGSGFESVLKTTVFLTDLGDFEIFNQEYAKFFGSSAPARSTVQVSKLPRGAKVEIEAVALRRR